jgi:acetyltransferase-like isoleucine patch superfamily enzyme
MIGEGTVVGASAVVARNIPSWKVVVGNPAVIKSERVLK